MNRGMGLGDRACAGRGSRVRAAEGSDDRLPGHGGAVSHRAGSQGDREGDRLQGQLEAVRRRRRSDQGDGVGRGADRRGRLGGHLGGAVARRAVRALLDPRRHRRRRSAGREERLGHQLRRRPQGQEDRDAVQLDDALPHHGRARAGEGESGRRADPQHAAARSARGVAARRHPGHVHLGPGARRSEEGRQGDPDVGQALGGHGQGDVRRLHREQGLGEGRTRTS